MEEQEAEEETEGIVTERVEKLGRVLVFPKPQRPKEENFSPRKYSIIKISRSWSRIHSLVYSVLAKCSVLRFRNELTEISGKLFLLDISDISQRIYLNWTSDSLITLD